MNLDKAQQTLVSQLEEILAVVLDGKTGFIQLTGLRVWRLFQAISKILEKDLIGLTSRQLSPMVGHLTHLWCLSRQLLAIPSAIYHFISRGFTKSTRLWPCILCELKWARDTLCFFLVAVFVVLFQSVLCALMLALPVLVFAREC